MASWKKLMIVIDVIFGALMICLMTIFCKNFKKNREKEAASANAEG
jgi:beta-glucosidase